MLGGLPVQADRSPLGTKRLENYESRRQPACKHSRPRSGFTPPSLKTSYLHPLNLYFRRHYVLNCKKQMQSGNNIPIVRVPKNEKNENHRNHWPLVQRRRNIEQADLRRDGLRTPELLPTGPTRAMLP